MIKGFGAETTLTSSQTSNMSEVPLSPPIASIGPQNNDMVERNLNTIFRSPTIKTPHCLENAQKTVKYHKQ
jgi:hypothetical protein